MLYFVIFCFCFFYCKKFIKFSFLISISTFILSFLIACLRVLKKSNLSNVIISCKVTDIGNNEDRDFITEVTLVMYHQVKVDN